MILPLYADNRARTHVRTPIMIDTARYDLDYEIKWRPQGPDVQHLDERRRGTPDDPSGRISPPAPWREAGDLRLDRAAQIATFTYTLEKSGTTLVQSWPAKYMTEARACAAGFLETLAVDVPAVPALDVFIASQGHDPHFTGQLANNSILGLPATIEILTRYINHLDTELQQTPATRKCSAIHHLWEEIGRLTRAYWDDNDLIQTINQPIGERLRALCVWGAALSNAAAAAVPYSAAITSTQVMCITHTGWPYP